MVRAKKAVEEGKPGAKLKLRTATKNYVDSVTAKAKKDAETKIADAKKKAAAISGVKKRTSTTAKKKATTTRTRKTTAKRKPAAKRR